MVNGRILPIPGFRAVPIKSVNQDLLIYLYSIKCAPRTCPGERSITRAPGGHFSTERRCRCATAGSQAAVLAPPLQTRISGYSGIQGRERVDLHPAAAIDRSCRYVSLKARGFISQFIRRYPGKRCGHDGCTRKPTALKWHRPPRGDRPMIQAPPHYSPGPAARFLQP